MSLSKFESPPETKVTIVLAGVNVVLMVTVFVIKIMRFRKQGKDQLQK